MSAQKKTVLIVDANPVDGQTAGMILERFGSGYACDVATGRQQAMTRLMRQNYDLVVVETDIEGQSDGLKVAQLIMMRRRPHSRSSTPLVVLLSSHPDRATIQQATTLGISDFIVKPYLPHAFLERIEKALSARQSVGDKEFTENMRKSLQAISQIPTLPIVFQAMQDILGAPEPSVETVSRIIQTDPAITMRVLRLANSAYFGFTKTVKTISHAITLLGFQTIRNMVLATSTFEALSSNDTSAGLDKTALWQHAVGTAQIGDFLLENVSPGDNDAFVGGLLHDMGKIVLDTFFSEQYAPVLHAAKSSDTPLIEIERYTLGVTHADVGAHLASMWNLPAELIGIIGAYLSPCLAGEDIRQVAAAVNIADAICKRLVIGNDGDRTTPVVDPAVLDLLQIQPEQIEEWLPVMQERAEKASSFLAGVAAS